MPTYTYQCHLCRELFDRILPLSRYQEAQISPCCNLGSEKILTPVMVRGDYEGYDCPVTGKRIEGKRAHEENLKRTGCRILEPGETESVKKNARKAEVELDKGVDETVERFFDALPSDKKEALASEIQSGANVAVERL